MTTKQMNLIPPTSTAARQRRIGRCGRAAMKFFAAFLASSAALALPTSPRGRMPRTTTHSAMPRRPPVRWRRDHHRHRATTTTTTISSSTALRFFFDRFCHPYGVSSSGGEGGGGDRTHKEDTGELLDALLPRLPTRADRSKMLEGFQRARLYEQLRLSKIKRSKRGVAGGDDGDGGNNEDSACGPLGRDVHGDDVDDDDDDDDEFSRRMGSFQRARLSEQLRLHKNNGRLWVVGGGTTTTTSHPRVDGEGRIRKGGGGDDSFDKYEAFQRALLEERLRNRRLQRQRQSLVGGSGVVERTMEFECGHSEERKASQTMTMIQESEFEEDDEYVDDSEKVSERYQASIDIASSANDDGRGNSNALSAKKLVVNRTEEDGPSIQLAAKLEKLRQMVTAATNPSSFSLISAIASNNTSSSIQSFLSTTHLPLPPREDASSLSLALAPVAHLLTSVFLLCTAGFYAAMAVVDVICNDDDIECSTRACLRGTSAVLRGCWEYLFPEGGGRNDGLDLRSAVRRTTRALQTSSSASYYAGKCILLRSFRHSKFAIESLDAVTGSLRYLVYMIRSVNVMLTRAMDVVRRSYEYIIRWTSICIRSVKTLNYSAAFGSSRSLIHKMKPLRVISNVKSATLKRVREQSYLQDERQRLGSDELYSKKIRLLNLDRVALERDRQQLQESWQQLEFEKRMLLAEGVNVLAWYAAVGELAERESHKEVEKRKERKWIFWRGRVKS